jgi:hypothetical protein
MFKDYLNKCSQEVGIVSRQLRNRGYVLENTPTFLGKGVAVRFILSSNQEPACQRIPRGPAFFIGGEAEQPPKLGLMVCFRGYPRNCAALGKHVQHRFMARNRSDNICFQMYDQLLDI